MVGARERLGDFLVVLEGVPDPLGGVEDMLREFALSTKEGLALMVLAEAAE